MKYATKLYEWILLLPALLPLLYIEGMMYPLMAPKTLALRAVGIVAVSLFTYLALSGKPFFWNRLRAWETWIPAVLLAVAYIASLAGIDFYHSFWSTFERGDGLLTLSVCVGYFYLILVSVDASWLRRLLTAVAWIGSIAALYLVPQWLDVPFLARSSGRFGGTLGNAAFLSSYLGLALFATLAIARESKKVVRRVLYTGAILELLAIGIAATRGTLLALLAVTAVVLISLAGKGKEEIRNYARITLAALLVCVALFFAFRTSLQDSPIESVRRLASISLTDLTVSSRLFVWGAVSKEAVTHPLLGYGAEHIDIPFDKVYDPTSISEEWFDRTHNAYLDYFVQFGVFGVLLYLALIIVFVRAGWRLLKKKDRYAPYLLCFAAVYSMQNFFVFDTGTTLWLFLAVVAATFVYTSSEKETPSSLSPVYPGAGVVLGFVLLLLVIPVAVTPFRANVLAFEAYLYQVADVPRANAAAQNVVALDTYGTLELGYNAYFMYTEEQLNRLSGDTLRAAYENARDILTHNFNRYPYDARTSVYLAQVLSLSPENNTIEEKALLSDVLTKAIQASPKRVQPWYLLENIVIAEANTNPIGSDARRAGYAAAKDVLLQYTKLVPRLAAPHFILAQLSYANGDTETAAAEAALGKAYYRGDLETAKRAASYYESVLDLPNAALFLREILRLDPENAAARDDLLQIEAYQRQMSR